MSYGAQRKNISNIDLYSNLPGIQAMDYHNLTFPDNCFDIIFWAGSFAYAHDPRKAAGQALRVVKKPGIIAIGDSLKGGATSEILLDSKPTIKEELDKVSSDVKYFTHPFQNIKGILTHFKDHNYNLKVLSSRKYLPNHANEIIEVRDSFNSHDSKLDH